MPGRMAACGWTRNFLSRWTACVRTRYGSRAATLPRIRTAIHNERAFNYDARLGVAGAVRAGRLSWAQSGNGLALRGVAGPAGEERACGMAGASAAGAGASGVDERGGRGVRTVADWPLERLGADRRGGCSFGSRRYETGQLAASTLGELDRHAGWIS